MTSYFFVMPKIILLSILIASLLGQQSLIGQSAQTPSPYKRANKARRSKTPIVRETQTVMVDGLPEQWRLEWLSAPKPVCPPEGEEWRTCPCHGFEFGEKGRLDLVRVRADQTTERLHLTPLFGDSPGLDQAALPRWQHFDNDHKREIDDQQFARQVRTRPLVSIMQMADYNRDGQASEFLLRIGSISCGHSESIVIGITRDNPKLHAFGTAEHPRRPLVLEVETWAALLLGKDEIKVVETTCGDHGSDLEREVVVRIDEKGIHATELFYKCSDQLERGPLVEQKKL